MARLRVLASALLAAAARATVIQVRDSWTYVSGTNVTVGGQLQPDVWRVCARTWRALADLGRCASAWVAGAMLMHAALRDVVSSAHHPLTCLTARSPAMLGQPTHL
jgi:hypothetical protein